MQRESMEFDVVIVGGGPAGLSAAIRLMQLGAEAGEEVSVCLVEKGSEVGAHILSGAILAPKSLNELLPDWQSMGAPVTTPVTSDEYYMLTSAKARIALPKLIIPRPIHNKGNYAISLGNLCRWLGEQAEEMGVNVFPDFAASEVLYNDDGSVKGVATGDMGIGKDGTPKDTHEPGYELHAKYTLFAEGCRGHLGKQLMAKFGLRENSGTQHYAIGLKELWDIDPAKHEPGRILHTLGWPLGRLAGTTGGSFLYHLDNNQVSLGLIVDPELRQPPPKPLRRDAALEAPPADRRPARRRHPRLLRRPGHRQGRPAGTAQADRAGRGPSGRRRRLPERAQGQGQPHGDEVRHARRRSGVRRPAARRGGHRSGSAATLRGVLAAQRTAFHPQRRAGLAQARHLLRLRLLLRRAAHRRQNPLDAPRPGARHATLKPAADAPQIDYPKPDGKLSFDKLSSVFLSNTNHEEDQPCHLTLADPEVPIRDNLPKFDEPAQRYCPAGVYEVVQENGAPRFQINAQNCVHCKTCDIKDPAQNINWVVPEGAGGPNYPNM